MISKTAPQPVLRYDQLPSILRYDPLLPVTATRPLLRADRYERRLDALRAEGAVGDRYVWPHFTLVATIGGVWIAQDDYLPFAGELDPIPAEWREVLSLAREMGYHNPGEPVYDSISGIYLWVMSS